MNGELRLLNSTNRSSNVEPWLTGEVSDDCSRSCADPVLSSLVEQGFLVWQPDVQANRARVRKVLARRTLLWDRIPGVVGGWRRASRLLLCHIKDNPHQADIICGRLPVSDRPTVLTTSWTGSRAGRPASSAVGARFEPRPQVCVTPQV